jgi:hypothetical protein
VGSTVVWECSSSSHARAKSPFLVFGSADGHSYFVEDIGKHVCQHETDDKKCGHVGVKHPSNLRSHLRMDGLLTPAKRLPPTRLEEFMSSFRRDD